VSEAEIVSNIGIYAGLVLIIPGIWLALRWSVVAQAAAIEHEGWLPALRRSATLTLDHYWHIAGLLLATGVLNFGVSFGASSALAGPSSHVGSVLLGIVVRSALSSFAALTLAVLYFDLLARQAEPDRRSIPEYQHLRDLD
jgi:hypothetical protein